MKATTHTEVYRRFDGELRAHPLRSVVLGWSGIRTGFKKKLPMLLLAELTSGRLPLSELALSE